MSYRPTMAALGVGALAVGALALPVAVAGPAQAVTADDTITVGSGAAGMAFSPNGTRAYVVNEDASSVSLIDVATHKVIATSDFVYGSSVEPSPDGRHVYVTINGGEGGITVLNARTLAREMVSGSPGFASRMAVSPDGTRLYSANDEGNTLTVSNASDLSFVDIIGVGPDPVDVRVSPDGHTAYVLNNGDDSVSVVDLTTDTVTSTIEVGDDPSQEVLSRDGATLYVARSDSHSLSVIDTATGTVTASDDLDFTPYGIDISPDGSKLYVTGDGAGFYVLDAATGAILDTGTVPATPYNVAVTPDGSQAWVVSRGSDVVTTFDFSSRPVTAPGVTRARFLSSARVLTTAGSPAATLSSRTPRICVVHGLRVATLAKAGRCRIAVHQSRRVVAIKTIKVKRRTTNSRGVHLMHVASPPFVTGQARLTDAARALLHERLPRLRSAHQVVVLGLAARPTAAQTGSVSSRRAAVVRDYLVAHGVTVSATRHVAHALHLRGPQPQTRRALVAWR